MPTNSLIAAPETAPLQLCYQLHELPSAQHQAGLAALVLLTRFVQTHAKSPGLCQLVRLDPQGAELVFDRLGFQLLLDELYDARLQEKRSARPWHGKKPLRQEPVKTPKGSRRARLDYVYEVLVPEARLLLQWEPKAPSPSWTELWREMLWNVLRAVPVTRKPFEERAQGRPVQEAQTLWRELTVRRAESVELASTYFLGAQTLSAEAVPIRDRTDHRFLLHFWPLVTAVYLPAVKKPLEDRRQFVGYALAVPEVHNLKAFCEQLPAVLGSRNPQASAHLPRQAIVDSALEAGLDLARRFAQQPGPEALRGVEVFQLSREGNTVRMLQRSHIECSPKLIRQSAALSQFWDPLVRRELVHNLLTEQPWHTGFDGLFKRLPARSATFGSETFRHDALLLFSELDSSLKDYIAPSEHDLWFAKMIYSIVHDYITGQLDENAPEKAPLSQDSPSGLREYRNAKGRIALRAFLDLRLRSQLAFQTYFISRLCSPRHKVADGSMRPFFRALRQQSKKAQTLTLFALCAHRA